MQYSAVMRKNLGGGSLCGACADPLMQGLACGMFQPLDLVLDHQFPALQLDNLQIVCGKMHESVVQFIFENLVFPFKFNKMRLQCHTKPPRWIRSGRLSVHEPEKLSMDIKNGALIFGPSYVTNREHGLPSRLESGATSAWSPETDWRTGIALHQMQGTLSLEDLRRDLGWKLS
jgi:hypothetical protein